MVRKAPSDPEGGRHSSLDGGDVGGNAGFERGAAGRFESKGNRAASFGEEDCFGPEVGEIGLGVMIDPAGRSGFVIIDQRFRLGWEPRPDAIDDCRSAIRAVIAEIDFVKIEAAGFPIFVQGEKPLGAGSALEPLGMGADLAGFAAQVVAVEVNALGVLTGIGGETSRIEDRTDRPGHVLLKEPAAEELQGSEGACRFVTMHARRKVSGLALESTDESEHWTSCGPGKFHRHEPLRLRFGAEFT